MSLGGADTALACWRNLAVGSISGTPKEGPARALVGGACDSDDDDTDDGEDGYDTDVDKETRMDYAALTYTTSIRETTGLFLGNAEYKKKTKKQKKKTDTIVGCPPFFLLFFRC